MKDTLLLSKEQFLEEFDKITKNTLDKIVLPLDRKVGQVSTSEVTGSLVEQMKKRIELYTDQMKQNFEDSYTDLIEAAAQSVNDILIVVDSQQTTLQSAVKDAVDGMMAVTFNGAEEFLILDETRAKLRAFAKSAIQKARDFGTSQYKKVRAFIKARVEVVVDTTKELWQGLKAIGKENGEEFRDDLNDILQDAIAEVFAPIPDDPEDEVKTEEIKRSLSDEITYRINQRVDKFAGNLQVYYKRLVDASSMAVQNLKIAINKFRAPMREAVIDAAQEVVDVTLNG
jgi:3-dehydroquinate dehydratase